jgi:ABC-type dipeptide/oligopeptide/nickel transport system ATPase subunit
MTLAIEIRNLHYSYATGNRQSCDVLKGVDFAVEQGAIFGLLGRSRKIHGQPKGQVERESG